MSLPSVAAQRAVCIPVPRAFARGALCSLPLAPSPVAARRLRSPVSAVPRRRGALRMCRAGSEAASTPLVGIPSPSAASLEPLVPQLPRRRIAVFVEVRRWERYAPRVLSRSCFGPPDPLCSRFNVCQPSPFSHTSGMKNRFLNLIANLQEQGDEARACDSAAQGALSLVLCSHAKWHTNGSRSRAARPRCSSSRPTATRRASTRAPRHAVAPLCTMFPPALTPQLAGGRPCRAAPALLQERHAASVAGSIVARLLAAAFLEA